VVEVNLHGVWNTVHAALPALRAHGEGGAIVLVSSTAGYKASSINGPGGEAYAASKHAVVGLMRQFAYHLGPEGIRVNTIHPAGTATDMVLNPTMQAHLQNEIDPTRPIYNVLPVHLVEPRDITEALLYLVGESGRYVTGLTLAVDAGFQVRL
jgi:NAD(P)-dependent dehydrogenase (short-subunit alcohol dehydrogenase family)